MIFICGSLSCHDVTLNDRVKIMLSLLSWRIKAIYVYWSPVPPAEQPIGSRGQRFGFFEQKKKVAHCALKMWILLTCTVRATCFYHHPPLYPVALFAWRRADAPVVDADCDGVCVCVFTHASQMAKLSGKCNSHWTCNSWAAQEHEVLQASLLFNNIRITGLEVQLVRAVTRSLRSPFMRNIFEFHQLKKIINK